MDDESIPIPMLRFTPLFVLCLAATLAAAAPCDVYAAGGTPCVAAHSTTRSMYVGYTGNLYQVRRSSDSTTLNIGSISGTGNGTGQVANSAAQDSFCSGTTCVITIIYDQSGNGNHLTQAPAGGAVHTTDNLAVANSAPVHLGGHKVYGVFIPPGTGYRNDATHGIATGDAAESMYAIFDGTHFNGGCCFDYGNAETSNDDTGAGHMEAISLGNIKVWGFGSGAGPWITADLENGLWSGQKSGENAADVSQTSRFVSGWLKGESNNWEIKAGNAQSGGLTTLFSGARPAGYNPMHKEGAIILGIGGDNSNGAQGTFYEGAMTTGFAADGIEQEIQADIVLAAYTT